MKYFKDFYSKIQIKMKFKKARKNERSSAILREKAIYLKIIGNFELTSLWGIAIISLALKKIIFFKEISWRNEYVYYDAEG